jgi:hypothetical protein
MEFKRLLIVSSLFFCSCAAINQTNDDQKTTDSSKNQKFVSLKPWIGKPISDILKHPKFGIPDNKEIIGNEVVLTYRQLFSASGHASDNSLSVNVFCRRSFVYDKDMKISNVLEEGTCQNSKDLLPIEEIKK